ncbi:MAG: ABC transporter ATP-binding protein, partial [Planctomycetota bacterium]
WIEQGRSLLLASHILHEVESITHSFLLICGGRLLASGAAEEIHNLLVDLPNEITLRCSAPQRLAERLVERAVAESVVIRSDEVVVSTRRPSDLYSHLPQWAADGSIEITEVRSADESLQSLFNALLRIHRGEL